MSKAELAAQIIHEGLKRAHQAGQLCSHLVVTAEEWLTLGELMERWKLLRQRLQRRGLIGPAYASVLGWNATTGRLHLHVVIAGGKYVPQKLVSQQAREVGLGQTHVKRIGPTAQDRHKISAYLGGNLLALREAPKADGHRLRPFNPSRSWPGGTLTQPAWRERVRDRRLMVVGFTRDGAPWARPMKGEQEADELLEAA